MFYIFHGKDTHSKAEKLANLLSRHGDPAMLELNTTQFSGLVPIATLREAAETIPFLAPIRVVIANDFFSSKPGKETIKEILAFLPDVPETTRLIFLESQALSKNHPAVLLANQLEQGLVVSFPLPEGHQIDRWIQQQVEKKGGDISPGAARLLASLVGNDLHVLGNELEKLVVYREFSSPKTIQSSDVTLLSPYVAEASIFDLVDALGNRNESRASTLYQQKLNEGADPFYLFSMFVRQFRLLIQVKELANENYAPQAIARELGLHEFVAGKLTHQARGFSMPELEQIYKHLLKIDVAVKIGKADIRTVLDLLVAQLTIAP
jgi:DNA polymerase-3 subunit delta